MLLATWNVNSLTARLPRVLEFLGAHAPDVLCLQETKVGEAAFPTDALAEAGYAAAHLSGGRWVGVAILSPLADPLYDVTRGLPGEVQAAEARWVEASVGGLRVCSVYVVNGRTLDAPQYAEKLAFRAVTIAFSSSCSPGSVESRCAAMPEHSRLRRARPSRPNPFSACDQTADFQTPASVTIPAPPTRPGPPTVTSAHTCPAARRPPAPCAAEPIRLPAPRLGRPHGSPD